MNEEYISKHPFNFPYPPYKIQIDLMNKIYDTLENKNIGIFSSPTGTGKSLSIICSTLTWFEDYKKKQREFILNEIDRLDEKIDSIDLIQMDDWVKQQSEKKDFQDQKFDLLNKKKKFDYFDLRSSQLEERKKLFKKKTSLKYNKKQKTDDNLEIDLNLDDEDEELLLDYNSDEMNEFNVNEENKEDKYVKPKIIYASRTHSQLSQFIGEIQKTIFKDKIRLITLGSRANLCINPMVNKCKNLSILNDKCIEMQKKNTKNCEFKKLNLINDLRDEFLSTNLDIEDAFEMGKKFKCCSYYAGRFAVEEAEMLVLPYNLLLHKATSETFKLDLEKSIVIIDEAHNLIDMISNINSIEVNCEQLMNCHFQLNQYMLKYNSRLSAENTMLIKQLIFVLNSIIVYIKNLKQSIILDVVNLELECNIDKINLFSLIKFCENSQLARKLFRFVGNQCEKKMQKNLDSSKNAISFLERMQMEKSMKKKKSSNLTKKKQSSSISSEQIENDSENKMENLNERSKSYLYQILEFLKTFTNRLEDGRFIINLDTNCFKKSTIKFILLNTSNMFDFIVQKARSIILIGGTMEPINQFTNGLFNLNNDKKIDLFMCDHVIADENLTVCALSYGPCNLKLDFSFKQRNNHNLIDEFGRILINICNLTPGGIIVFFVSYDYEEKVFTHLKKTNIINLIEKKGKKVFCEPRNSIDLNQILDDYSSSIYALNDKSRVNSTFKTGAVLFSVVSGKMSEGINFNDDLCRCVIMVGLPYANIKSIELKQKMDYLEKMNANHKTNKECKQIAQDYYENLCMKAVNQSIGRAIRHQRDYASILLLDYRYCTKTSVIDSLPGWIRKRYTSNDEFVDCLRKIKKFFSSK